MSATCLQENPPSYLHNNGYYKMNKNKTEYKYEIFEEISANICFRKDRNGDGVGLSLVTFSIISLTIIISFLYTYNNYHITY